MYDTTPSPLGDITRRWTQLPDAERDRHVTRLLDNTCPDAGPVHVDRPALDGGCCYRPLVPAAVGGDPVAIGWLATTHRPLLVARGRALLEHDASEWGAVCLEALHVTLASADLSEVRWLRRRVARRLTSRLAKAVVAHLDRRSREQLTVPDQLRLTQPWTGDPQWDLHALDLSVELDRALAGVDAVARDALLALADDVPLSDVAARHGLSYVAVRQRVSRARRRLQPELAAYRRTAA